MNISAMTLDEVRDKLAELRGWEKHRATGSTKEDGEDGLYWKRKGRMTWDHPIPNTLDEAAKLPEECRGCETIHVGIGNTVAEIVAGPLMGTLAEAPTELEARFRLRLACELAEKEAP